MNFTLRATLGFIVRLLLITPFALLLVDMGEYANINSNISVFIAVVLGIATVLYLAIMTFVPAEYAVRTNINILEFHMWKPQALAVIISAVVVAVLSITLAASAMYYSGFVMLLYAVSLGVWPKYIKRIDVASKEHMIANLQN